MNLTCYRIVKLSRKQDAFDGEGARLFGGRWNSKGQKVIYTSGSLSLALLETLVHLESHEILGRQFCHIRLEFPEDLCIGLELNRLPEDWDEDIPNSHTQSIGDDWIKSMNSAILAVPSAIVPSEMNYLINPLHPDFTKIVIHTPDVFSFPLRLLKQESKPA